MIAFVLAFVGLIVGVGLWVGIKEKNPDKMYDESIKLIILITLIYILCNG